jgi:DNA modification methylase
MVHGFGLEAEGGEEGLLLATYYVGDQVDRLGYDPFCGCGSTLLAAHQVGRMGYGVEIDPGYVAVTLERLAALGVKPELVK